MSPPVLVTGAAGFIGFHVARRLLESGVRVVGADSFTSYYDPRLKEARFAELARHKDFAGARIDLADEAAARALFREHRPQRVVHLAAQPGVRRALTDPHPYVAANVVGFLNILEGCRHGAVEHLVYASSSSVYGANRKLPFSERDPVDHPISLYAATKKADELMAHAYAHLFGLPATGLRFFTVYGPWGRPDMAVYAFTDAIAEGRPIEVANGGKVWRDFTYVDDVVEGVVRVLDQVPTGDAAWNAEAPDPGTSAAPHRVYNIGNDRPEELNQLVALIEAALGRTAKRIDRPLPPGDVLETRADITALRNAIGFAPATPLQEGIRRFVEWYRSYHHG
ncbi:MAG TPA: NAD-dependent epimerase [Beijerinckiaceae bacterium]|jgi:UDP-glucuronate 4-epimerase